jgi:hypothetical protein
MKTFLLAAITAGVLAYGANFILNSNWQATSATAYLQQIRTARQAVLARPVCAAVDFTPAVVRAHRKSSKAPFGILSRKIIPACIADSIG